MYFYIKLKESKTELRKLGFISSKTTLGAVWLELLKNGSKFWLILKIATKKVFKY